MKDQWIAAHDHYFRLQVVEVAQWHINEIKWNGQEYADERLPAKVKQLFTRTFPISQEDAMAVVLRHITYLQAQAESAKKFDAAADRYMERKNVIGSEAASVALLDEIVRGEA